MAGLVPKKLNELQQKTKNAIITAVILSKSEPKIYLFKKSNEFRGTITFTIRDSKTSVCNCKYWGNKETVDKYNRQLKIGDVINVVCPTVVYHKYCSGKNANFLPSNTIPIVLYINEGEGSLEPNDYHNIEMFAQLQELMFIPHRPICDALRLSDIRYSYSAVFGGSSAPSSSNKTSMPTQSVDLIVMVALLRPVKEIQRSDDIAHCLEIVVFDQSIEDGVLLTIWQNEWIDRAQRYWKPMKTVLHLIDVNVVDSHFHKCCVLRKSARTIIYENPLGKECDSLREFVTKMPPRNFQAVGQMVGCMDILPHPDDINTQMTVKQIYMRIDGYLKDDSEEFSAVLYAMVTNFDIDGYNSIIGRKCKSCKRCVYDTDVIVCNGENCASAKSRDCDDPFDYFYNVNVHFSDHTGTLIEARLTGAVAERIFETSAENFIQKYKDKIVDLHDLKWLYIFNRFEVKLIMKKRTATRRRLMILVAAMKSIDEIAMYSNKMMVF